MIARVRKAMDEREKGFTLIELLVVIIIIGILAAIAIPAFLNQRQNGWAAQVESDLKNAAIAAESYAVGNNGDYTGLTIVAGTPPTGTLVESGYRATEDVVLTITTANEDGFEFSATHDLRDAADVWTYSSDTGVIDEP